MSQSNIAAAPVHIGWSQITITPDMPVQLQGQLHERVSTHVNDPCTATALAIECKAPGAKAAPEQQAIIISVELVNLSLELLEPLRKRVGAALPDFDSSRLLVCATHSHTSPVMSPGIYKEPDEGIMGPRDYAPFLLAQLEAVATQAWRSRVAGKISHALGQAAIGYNRRVVYKDGSAKMYGSTNIPEFKEIEGPSDPQIEMLFTYDADDNLTGVAACPACPGQVVEGHCFVSADFWGVTREMLRQQFGDHVNLLGMTSAAGDQSPRDLVRRGRGEPSMRALDGMKELGRRLAMAIIDAHGHAQSQMQSEIVLEHQHALLSLPMRKATKQEADEARNLLDELLAKHPDADRSPTKESRWARRYAEAIERFETQGDNPQFQADVHFLRVGDVAIATNPFELFLEFSHRIKARSPASQTFVVQLTNDRGRYLPTEKAVRGGSYSAMIYDNVCGPQGGDELVEQTLAAINRMFS